jgi:hypothetical protein
MYCAMRSRTEHRLVWIDSICIDQKNASEKAYQIGLMNLIYNSAERDVGRVDIETKTPASSGSSSISPMLEIAARLPSLEFSPELASMFPHFGSYSNSVSSSYLRDGPRLRCPTVLQCSKNCEPIPNVQMDL